MKCHRAFTVQNYESAVFHFSLSHSEHIIGLILEQLLSNSALLVFSRLGLFEIHLNFTILIFIESNAVVEGLRPVNRFTVGLRIDGNACQHRVHRLVEHTDKHADEDVGDDGDDHHRPGRAGDLIDLARAKSGALHQHQLEDEYIADNDRNFAHENEHLGKVCGRCYHDEVLNFDVQGLDRSIEERVATDGAIAEG